MERISNEVRRGLILLDMLEKAGVDNWPGYDEAYGEAQALWQELDLED